MAKETVMGTAAMHLLMHAPPFPFPSINYLLSTMKTKDTLAKSSYVPEYWKLFKQYLLCYRNKINKKFQDTHNLTILYFRIL